MGPVTRDEDKPALGGHPAGFNPWPVAIVAPSLLPQGPSEARPRQGKLCKTFLPPSSGNRASARVTSGPAIPTPSREPPMMTVPLATTPVPASAAPAVPQTPSFILPSSPPQPVKATDNSAVERLLRNSRLATVPDTLPPPVGQADNTSVGELSRRQPPNLDVQPGSKSAASRVPINSMDTSPQLLDAPTFHSTDPKTPSRSPPEDTLSSTIHAGFFQPQTLPPKPIATRNSARLWVREHRIGLTRIHRTSDIVCRSLQLDAVVYRRGVAFDAAFSSCK